ncbi:MAG TPA: S9 family peptidase [Blastocatellia bacterium]|nr:S9 family peptidase [Blastocatellia bacterium]
MKITHHLRLLLLTSLTLTQLFAQQPNPSTLTVERIFASREFAAERFGPPRWLEGGAAYTTIEASAIHKGADDLIRYDSASGQRSVLIAAEQLIPKGQTTPLQIEDYDWSADGKRVLIFTNTVKVWRYNTRGDYWVLDRATKSLTKLGGEGAASTLMFAKFSPDGMRVGYVRDNTLLVENLSDHKITQLSDKGSRTHINGTFDWVYEEELDCRDGWRWSPDGKRIAYWQLDATGVRDFFLINNTDSLYPTLTPIPYPKTGETNSAARIGIVNADGGETKWMEISGDPRNQYLARMEWMPGTEQVIIQRLNRLQNTNDVLVGEMNGKTRTLLTDKDEAWVDIHSDNLTWLNNGKQFMWISERDGWRHAYLASRDSGELKLITNGAYDIVSITGVDEKGGWLYFTASPDNATQRYLYRTRLDGSGKAERLSQQSGTNAYNISPDCRWAFHTYSTLSSPPRISFVRLPQHQEARVFTDNAKLRERLSGLQLGKTEFFKVKIANDIELDGYVIKPPDFDPNKKYPLLFYVYGEPAGQTVLDGWRGSQHLWHLMLSQQGYLIVSVDNRGTPAPRGRAWRKIVYRKIGILASEEQAAAAKQITAWPFVDASRVAVWGWSGGGSMTLNLLFRSPEIYKVGMSVAPVSNQQLYDSIYQERYMGLPQDNAEDYKQGSPVTFADKLQGKLLLVHGTGDDNVHYQSAELLVNALIAANKPFTMMAYPNRSHSINEGANTSRHLHELLTRFLRENMPPGAKEK